MEKADNTNAAVRIMINKAGTEVDRNHAIGLFGYVSSTCNDFRSALLHSLPEHPWSKFELNTCGYTPINAATFGFTTLGQPHYNIVQVVI